MSNFYILYYCIDILEHVVAFPSLTDVTLRKLNEDLNEFYPAISNMPLTVLNRFSISSTPHEQSRTETALPLAHAL